VKVKFNVSPLKTHPSQWPFLSFVESEPDSDDEEKIAATPADFFDEEEDERIERELADIPAGTPGSHGAARLSCPACFALLCTDCQRHAHHKTQWRAMFVTENCAVAQEPLVPEGAGPDEKVYPVSCATCGNSVGVLDCDEVYHFFSVAPGL